MKNILFILLLLSPVVVLAQSQDQNYIQSTTYREPSTVITSPKKIKSITYHDGIGRPKQTIAIEAGGQNQDNVTPIVYDRLGRQFRQYLPFANSLVGPSSSNYREHNNLITSINSVYLGKYPDDISSASLNPYNETFYESSSPLNRVSEQAAPGTAWKGNPAADTDHTIKYAYETNATNEVRSFKVNFVNGNTENTELALSGHYSADRLYKNVVKDENWQPGDGKNKTTEEFKDKQGNVVLKRTYNQGSPHDTYYVYDVYGNLTYVIPPLASDDIVIESRTITPIGVNYPWTVLSRVDQSLAEAYGRELEAYQNDEILNLDLLDKYGGQGGFSVIPDENGNLVVNINITTAAPMEYRMGPIVDLKPLGSFADSEVGRIKGTGYDYMFIIRSGKLEVIGAGKVPSMNLSFTASPLEYSQNYPWTKLCQADPNIVKNYETAISSLDNSEILTTYTPNPLSAMGGVSVSLDEFDTLTLSVNITTNTALELVSGTAFPLDIERSIADRNLGVIDGELNGVPFHYELSIRGNSLYINGSGKFTHLNHFSSQISKSFYDIRETALDGLCYIYHYDKRNRVIEKHIPGKGWEHIVYDRLDRPVLTQDENLRHDNNWLFTKYEMYGRVAYTGMLNSTNDRLAMQAIFNNPVQTPMMYEMRRPDSFTSGTNAIDYTNWNYPTAIDVYTVSYYDDYVFRPEVQTPLAPVFGVTPATNVWGQVTGNDIRILGTDNWIYSMTGYDHKGRTIYTWSRNNFLEIQQINEYEVDFMGNITRAKNIHTKNGQSSVTINDTYTFDHMNRPVKHTQKVNSQPERLISWNWYDEFGQLTQKKVGDTYITNYTSSSTGLQTIDYAYNIRGWLTGINNITDNMSLSTVTDLFAFKINYNLSQLSGSTGLYNGNISETRWKSKSDNKLRSYNYTYDALNRLTNANYTGSTSPVNEKLTEGPITYDKNGNIKALTRWGYIPSSTNYGLIDVLSYSYYPYSNELKRVSDTSLPIGFDNGTTGTGTDYSYDLNGNMEKDLNKGLGVTLQEEITYNHLNLPVMVTKDSTHKVKFVYDATGAKQQKVYINGANVTTTDYSGDGFVYEKVNSGTNILQFFSHAEGYAKRETNNTFSYIYQYKDHLGNIRLSYTDINNNGAVTTSEIVEQDNYYAFGMKHDGYNIGYLSNGSALAQKYKYQGQERNDELGLNWDSFKWRNYDYAIGRFFNIDPLAEKYTYQSPYNFAENRVIWARELEGLEAWYTNTGSTNPHDNPMLRPQAGPLATEAAKDFGYTQYGVTQEQFVDNGVGDKVVENISNMSYSELNPGGLCFAVAKNRINQAYEEVTGEGLPTTTEFNKQWNVVERDAKAALGSAGALSNAGLGDLKNRDQIIGGELKPGAAIQVWTHSTITESLDNGGYGHSFIFLNYAQDGNGNISGMNVADQGFLNNQTVSFDSYPVINGANLGETQKTTVKLPLE